MSIYLKELGRKVEKDEVLAVIDVANLTPSEKGVLVKVLDGESVYNVSGGESLRDFSYYQVLTSALTKIGQTLKEKGV
jgi:hypothetical protein